MRSEELKWIDSAGDPRMEGLHEPPSRFRFSGVEFHCSITNRPSTTDRFLIMKDYGLVKEYVEILSSFRGAKIIEVGIAGGGSVALMSLLTSPQKLVAVDLADQRVAALDELIASRHLGDRVKPVYGISQADRQGLSELVESEFAGQEVDLIIDDASHRPAETRITFETLFPHLRAGGLYVIEDWNHDHLVSRSLADALKDPNRATEIEGKIAARIRDGARPQPLSRLVFEILLAQAESDDFLTRVTVGPRFVGVRRGAAPLPIEGFRLRDLYTNDLGLLASS